MCTICITIEIQKDISTKDVNRAFLNANNLHEIKIVMLHVTIFMFLREKLIAVKCLLITRIFCIF